MFLSGDKLIFFFTFYHVSLNEKMFRLIFPSLYLVLLFKDFKQ